MREISKNDILVLENQTGGRVALQIQKAFSSRVFYQQISSNGGLDFTKLDDNVLKKSQLERYKVRKCSGMEEAEHLTHGEIEEECLDTFDNIHN